MMAIVHTKNSNSKKNYKLLLKNYNLQTQYKITKRILFMMQLAFDGLFIGKKTISKQVLRHFSIIYPIFATLKF